MSDVDGWFRPCNYGDCAEVMETDDGVWVRSSRNSEAVVAFTVAEWRQFVTDVRAGRFDDVAPAAGGDDDDELERLRGIERRARDFLERPGISSAEAIATARYIVTGDPGA